MIKKRFIAGAICPRCSALDRIVMYERDDIQVRECVACGYQDDIGADGVTRTKEVETRVNQPRADVPVEEDIQVVKVFSSSKDNI